jgi:hypothetical protein
MTPADYPTPEEIAEWGLEVLDAPPTVTRPWAVVEWSSGCDYCGSNVASPVTESGGVYDGDPAVCVGCGSVLSWSTDAETAPWLADPHAILSPDALARLRGELGVSP